MKHVSKFDSSVYEICESVDLEAMNKGERYREGITLIWKDAPCDIDLAYEKDIPPRELIGWYFGEYDYDDVEWQIKHYYQEKLKPKEKLEQKKPKTMDLPICYVHLIQDCLQTIQDHNLYELIDSYDKDKESIEHLKGHIEDVLERFCKPLDELDEDTEVILED